MSVPYARLEFTPGEDEYDLTGMVRNRLQLFLLMARTLLKAPPGNGVWCGDTACKVFGYIVC